MAVIDEAEQDGLKDIKLDLARSDILFTQKKVDEVVKLLPAIAEKYPDHPMSATALAKLGSLHISQKDFKAAQVVLDDAAHRSASPDILFLRAPGPYGCGRTLMVPLPICKSSARKCRKTTRPAICWPVLISPRTRG